MLQFFAVLFAAKTMSAQVLPSPGLDKTVPQVEVRLAGLGRGASEASLAAVKDELKRGILQEITALKHGIITDYLQGAKVEGSNAKHVTRSSSFLATKKDNVGGIAGYEKAAVALTDQRSAHQWCCHRGIK